MKKKINQIAFIGVLIVLTIAMQTKINAQQLLLNEIEIDPPSATNNACQYVEIRGTPGAVVPANTYFLSVNSDGANFGFANQAVNFGGQVVGANGTITLFNTSSGACPNRVFPAGTTVFNYFSALTIGTGSETYLLVRSTGTLTSGSDLDVNDDFVLDPNFGITVLDGFALLANPEEEPVYGASAGVVNISNTNSLDQPDAVTRFLNNANPFVAAAFYYGELAASPDETTAYAAPFSRNFPAGGMLTPGAPNVGAATANINEARADFDGDGRSDLSVFRPSTGFWFFFLSNTNAPFGFRFGQSGDTILPGDYDGDNRADTAVRRGTIWFILNSRNATATVVDFGLASDIPVPRDYDGDGRTDIAVFRPSMGFWYVLRSSNGLIQSIPFGQSGDVPVPGDYDGDGRDDVAVFRNGTWLLNQSPSGMIAIPFGFPSDMPVQADYDGDGREDIAVYRSSNSTWYILRSSNNMFALDRFRSFVSIPFGQSGDIPVPGDYDGDGRDDVAVFRNGTWFINQTTAGLRGFQFGVASDEPVPNAYLFP